ncbi:MAG: hypothetical protein MJ180_04230 [Candidatus Gastranaerophilales bacterium]|nr:hypothetical protein [Candidatus Gastranaerophilales bacterium]
MNITNNYITPKVLSVQNYKNSINFNVTKLNSDNTFSVSFKRNDSRETISYRDFVNKYTKQYPNAVLEDTVKNIIQSTKEINRGQEKKVFIFPQMDMYLIGYLYNKSSDTIPQIHQCKMQLPKHNFGQPIATNNDNIIIMKKLNGIPNSVNNYWRLIDYIKNHGEVTESASKEYLSKLRILINFPQSAYNKLAEQLLYIDKKSDFTDFINPNNLLLDKKNKQFNLIDMVDMIDMNDYLTKRNVSPVIILLSSVLTDLLKTKHNGDISYYMYSLLLDSKLQPYFLDKLSKGEQEEVITISREVIDKCKKALKKCNYPKKKETSLNTRLTFIASDIIFGFRLNPRYKEFLKQYNL